MRYLVPLFGLRLAGLVSPLYARGPAPPLIVTARGEAYGEGVFMLIPNAAPLPDSSGPLSIEDVSSPAFVNQCIPNRSGIRSLTGFDPAVRGPWVRVTIGTESAWLVSWRTCKALPFHTKTDYNTGYRASLER